MNQLTVLLRCLLGILLAARLSIAQQSVSAVLYNAISDANLCIRSNFTITYQQTSGPNCAFLCSQTDRCQAFTIAEGPCRLFVFDKCSKYVRDCTCNRKGAVFIKQQSGIDPRALCPAGYGDDLCGVKYRLYLNVGNWSQGRQKCESEKGLVIMSDIVDSTEMDYINVQYPNISFWLGGLQMPGSAEPLGGWYWVGCNFTVGSSLWSVSEPNNEENVEHVVEKRASKENINDLNENNPTPHGVLCECVTPFV